MITITLEMLGPIAQTGGTKHQLPEGTRLYDWLSAHVETQPANIQRWLIQENKIAPTVLVVLNNEQVQSGTNPELQDGDEVLIIPPISGG